MLKVEFLGHFDNSNGRAARLSGPAHQSSDSLSELKDIGLVVWHVDNWKALARILATRPNAHILIVSNGGPTRDKVQTEVSSLPATDQARVHGCAQGGSLEKALALLEDLARFFESGEVTPQVRELLGLDLPLRRLALRAALEIARFELETRKEGSPLRTRSQGCETKLLLGPALRIACETPLFGKLIEPVLKALEHPDDLELLSGAVDESLAELRRA